MAESFLSGLPKIDVALLPEEGSRCIICLTAYGTETGDDGAVETAVRLPCGHVVGAECIRIWLSPDKEAKNSCPMCRCTFFPAQPQPDMGFEILGQHQENRDEPVYDATPDDWQALHDMLNSSYIDGILRVIGEDGQPPQDGPEVETSDQAPPQEGPEVETSDQAPPQEGPEVETRDLVSLVRSRWPQFLGRSAAQYQASLKRALAIVTTPRGPGLEAGVDALYPDPPHPDSWHPVRLEDIDPEVLEDFVQDTATAYRTLPFREALLYSFLQVYRDNSRYEITAPIDEVRPLNAEQEQALFQEMESRGAFPRRDFQRHYAGLTNRQRWQSHRDCGETFSPLTGFWSTDWIGW